MTAEPLPEPVEGPLTALATFTAETRFSDLPDDVITKAKSHLLDTLGAALAGSTSAEATAVIDALTRTEAGGPAPIWGIDVTLAPRSAALINGVAAHAFELDDSGGCDHSGAVVIPAALATVEIADRPVSGADLLTAIVIGYDVARRVLEACGGYSPHNEAGWHSTGTCGPFGAAAAVASLLRLDSEQTAQALALAASTAGGTWAFVHDGAMSKRLHAGRAAESGVVAALLARSGITGPSRIFDDVWGGFLATFAGADGDPAALTVDLGLTWRVMRASIKPHASCRSTHSSVDAVGMIMNRHQLTADDVRQIRVQLNPFVFDMCGAREVDPLPAAQLSLPYAVAARIALGSAGLSAYETGVRRSERLRMIMDRVFLEVDHKQGPQVEPTITLTTISGDSYVEQVTDPLGSATNPLAPAELRAKFDQLASRVLPDDQVQSIATLVERLDQEAEATVLIDLLRAGGRR